MKRLPLFFLIFCTLGVTGCGTKEYIIGYTGSLSRDVTEISLGGRDGVILAIEEINKSGGINHKKLSLRIRDDKDEPSLAPVVDSELVAEDAIAIVGHLNSTMTDAGLKYLNTTNTLLISPNSNSPIFLNKDDNLFCILPSGESMVRTMVDVLVKDKGKPTLAIVYNGRNLTYTTPVSELLAKLYREAGGTVTGLYASDVNQENFNYEAVAARAIEHKPQAIAIITNALDAAFLARSFYDLKAGAFLIGADATCNEEVLGGSGEPVEGFITVQAYTPDSSSQTYVDFVDRFKRRFGYNPSYDAMFSYSAVYCIAEALKKNSNPDKLKETLLEIGTFKGVAYMIRFNEFGDNTEPYTVLEVRNGSLVPYGGSR